MAGAESYFLSLEPISFQHSVINLCLQKFTTLAKCAMIEVPCLNGLKYFQNRDHIHLSCFFTSTLASVTSWLKQTPGEKPLLVASVFRTAVINYYNGFDKISRFKALRDESSFNLSITNTEPSDSATYYCAVTYFSDIALADCRVVVVNGSSPSLYTVLQTPVLDSVEEGGNTTLQCSVLTDATAGEHSVYWLRHGSGESPPGIIYIHGDTNSQCSRSSETDSPTQSCVYKLSKTNLSLFDAGTYYCAVAVCGQILFGNGTKLDFVVGIEIAGFIKYF
ncbi:immunoglobulin alpha-2 heavy chain-like [Hoplias malabaricus]|uniref:immunoglobulin alpha-2 heavy chain-like n=1 Tax=Hoplias malabaricus TaxID=27720 RepID=UPI003461FCE1